MTQAPKPAPFPAWLALLLQRRRKARKAKKQ